MKIWLVLLAIWMLVYGAAAIFHLSFEGMGAVMGILAIADGILIFMNK
ncbi:MAG TPA: hypothetical protein VGP72_02090 [Planctomycetota bacterium]|jgi:hypothetical protein